MNQEFFNTETLVEIKTLVPETMLSNIWIQFPMGSILLGIVYISVIGFQVIARRLEEFNLNLSSSSSSATTTTTTNSSSTTSHNNNKTKDKESGKTRSKNMFVLCCPAHFRRNNDRPNCTLTSCDMDILYQTIEALLFFFKRSL
jgi:hypothetical protein